MIIISLSIFLLALIVASGFMVFGNNKRNEKIIIVSKYILPLTLIIYIFLWNLIADDKNSSYSFLMFAIGFLVNANNIYQDYMRVMKKPLTKEGYHLCISSIMSIVLIFAITFSAIESYIPNSFSNISVNDPIAVSIDFIYFSITTLTTVGFGDIAPQTTLARAIVTLEIIVAFAMLVLAVNFFVTKKDNNNLDAKIDNDSANNTN